MNATSLEELLSLSFQRELAGVYTAIPCIITNIPKNLEDVRVDVQPCINQQYADGTFEEHTQILGVPLIYPSGRTTALTFPVFVGDTVLCVFSQSGLDNFKTGNGQPTGAPDFRRMDSQDAIAIPGLVPFGKSLNRQGVRSWPHSTADAVYAHNIATGTEVEIRMKPNGNIIINTNQDAFINCRNASLTAASNISMTCDTFDLTAASSISISAPSTSWTGAITQGGDYTQTGTYILGSVNMNLHVHGGVATGPGKTLAPE